MTDKETPNSNYAGPVIYVHAKGRAIISPTDAGAMLELGLPLCSRLPYEGWTQTRHGYDQAHLLLAELAEKFPDQPVIFMRAGLSFERQQIDELLTLAESDRQASAWTTLSNADVAVNPFAGTQPDSTQLKYDFAGLVKLLAPGKAHRFDQWCDHFMLLNSTLVKQLARRDAGPGMLQNIQAAKGVVKLVDSVFLMDAEQAVISGLELKNYERPCPPVFGELSARIQHWFDAGISQLPFTPDRRQPATLHITHSWGGGVAQWVKSFISACEGEAHYQLRSEGPQSGRGFGQKISLYAGNELSCPLASWWLNPAIASVVESHDVYRQILNAICHRYGIGRVMVSSLVGHSLDALRTGLPSLQILHDHFPLWPLLSVNPMPYLDDNTAPNLEKAMDDHRSKLEFTDKSAQQWQALGEAYTQALEDHQVKIAAPGKPVLDLQTRLSAVFNSLDTSIIPHGLPDIEATRAIQARPRDDGRLRMVILGRMQTGKGPELLSKALPELTKHVQVYLLGTGKSGEQFFGMAGVDVVVEYQRDELADILSTIGPHFAALLSVVPETFSFTLSELQQFQIPAIATRLGSFPNRIEHDQTGWLIDASADALVQQVKDLVTSPERIEAVRARLPEVPFRSMANMVESYQSVCPVAEAQEDSALNTSGLVHDQTAALAFESIQVSQQVKQAISQNKALSREVEQRTEWAQDTNRQLKAAQEHYEHWIANQSAEIERLDQLVVEQQTNLEIFRSQIELADKDYQLLEQSFFQLRDDYQALTEEKNWLYQSLQDLDLKHQQLRNEHRRLQAEFRQERDFNELILGSTSWKLTKPLRAGNRFVGNLKRSRAWNPARWPWLISQLVKSLSTAGFVNTLKRMQEPAPQTVSEPPAIVVTPVVEEEPEIEEIATAPAEFPVHDKPKASVIIPVYNKWNYTAACLTSLLEHPGEVSFEVIVVDDQSSDATADQLKSIDGITNLRNEQNLGFVGSCNRGARHARGEYVVFLNNDTQVTDGWLDELINTFDEQAEAGLVGSRLVYPDGTLQESGGIIFSDGSGWNYGRNQDAQNPEYHFLREADYVSGASIALKTEVFNRLGAFDERYAPAYYEDTDLAFKVREAGLKVFIQPLSVIIHHEGVTSGTDTSSGTKQYQLINQKKFLERWQHELQHQPAPVNDPNNRAEIFFASSHRVKKRILIIDATTPEPDKDSGSVRLTNLMQCCREMGFGVTFFADNLAYAGKYTRQLQRNGIEVLYHPPIGSLHEFFRQRGREFDFVMISRHYVAINYIAYIKRYCPQAKFIFDTVDLHYLREQRQAELEASKTLRRTAKQTKRSELTVIKAADATLVVSTVEVDVLKSDAPGQDVSIVSNIHPVPGRDKAFADRKDIFFVGGYQHPPNVDAAIWFVNDVWPLIHEQLPEMKFHLIGSKAPDEVRALDGNGVVFHGFVKSLDPYLSDCRLAVAPLRYGAGVKGKVNMSMAHGQPVVATSAAVEGMFAKHEREILVADDAEAFAAEVIRLYQDEDLWMQISDASVKNVEEHFSLATARKNLADLFKALSG